MLGEMLLTSKMKWFVRKGPLIPLGKKFIRMKFFQKGSKQTVREHSYISFYYHKPQVYQIYV